jgi:alkylation response protein AidB-like acyl-CoA dehydrogenase
MDLGLTEIQQMLKTSAQEFLAQECPPSLVRDLEEDPRGYTDELWRQMAGLGWTGLPFAEEYGGSGGSFMDLAVLLEEMGKALVPGPFFPTVVLGGLTVADAGTREQKHDILPGVCEGSLRLTLALTEPSASYEPWGVETTATARGDDYILNGTKLFVPYAHAADILLVAARTSPAAASSAASSEGITLFMVPAGTAGLTVEVLGSIASDKQCEMALDQVRVSKDAILGGLNQGWPVVHRALQRATAAMCAQMLGGADAIVDMTVDYVTQRTQFGRPIGSFQAIQHQCAQMATDVEGCRNIVHLAAWSVSEGMPSEREVAMAKAWTSQAYQRVCTAAHQCHGAIGFTKEHDLQLYTRRAKVMELSYGDVETHREAFFQQIESL